MALNPDILRQALSTVQDPDLGQDIVTLGMLKDVAVDGTKVAITVELTTPACPMKDRIERDCRHAIETAANSAGETVDEIDVTFTAQVRNPRTSDAEQDNPLPNVTHVVAVGAGKGGVGKSTVSVNLAVGLARMGSKVGLLDGDIYGPSLPTMLGLDGIQPEVRGNTLLPFEVHGIKAMTLGKLVEPEKALIWRGPMAHSAFKQLCLQTDWGQLDYLIIDLPPGTGDVPLTLSQLLPLTGAVVVCTPQKVAQDDAVRAVRMFQQLNINVLGITENMSYFIGDDGKEYDIFGRGGAEMMAQRLNLPFLGSVPISMAMREHGDVGTPLKNFADDGTVTKELNALCQNFAAQVSISTLSGTYVQPTLSIS